MKNTAYENIAKAAAKLLKKDDVYLESKNGEAFVSNGHWLIKMPLAMYDLAFRPASPLFIDLHEEGVYSRSRNNAKSLPARNGSVSLSSCWESGSREHKIGVTSIVINNETTRYAAKELRLLAYKNGDTVFINEDYYKMCRNVGHREICGRGDCFSPVYFLDSDFDIDVMILPIRFHDGTITNMTKLFEYLNSVIFVGTRVGTL